LVLVVQGSLAPAKEVERGLELKVVVQYSQPLHLRAAVLVLVTRLAQMPLVVLVVLVLAALVMVAAVAPAVLEIHPLHLHLKVLRVVTAVAARTMAQGAEVLAVRVLLPMAAPRLVLVAREPLTQL
jgi:hypothetical protein